MNIRKATCLSLIILFIIGFIVMFINPPIEKNEKGIDGFNHYNRFVSRCLSEQFEMWTTVTQAEMHIYDHYYRYSCAMAGNPTFLVSVKMQFDDLEEYKVFCQQLLNVYPAIETDKTLNICGNASDDYKWFFDSEMNDGRYVYLEYSIMNEEKLNIQFVFALLYDEMEKDDLIISIAKSGYALITNSNFKTSVPSRTNVSVGTVNPDTF